ncbi:hypothetical protein Brsp06_03475 [Brucella sp. NBRC 13694]|uniref:hypothetical protein n=1 Tax=Brucella sp. NBRC 13694 TaxID=3075482 RepID=UPI0030B331DC
MTTITTPPNMKGYFDNQTLTVWAEYTDEVLAYACEIEDNTTIDCWYFDEHEQFKRIDHTLIGRIVGGQQYELPVPSHMSFKFSDPNDKNLLLIKLLFEQKQPF